MQSLAAALAVMLLAGACAAVTPSLPPTPTPAGTPARTASDSPSQTPQRPTLPPAAFAGVGEFRADVSRQAADVATNQELRALVAADTNLALRLYRELAESESDDVFLSPYSISTALSMAYAGAAANTAEQMADVLGIGLDDESWHAARNRLELEMIERAAQPVRSGQSLTLEPTNAMFGQAGFPFEDDFLRVLAAYYGAGMQALDFEGDPDASRKAINEWVAQKTRNRIEELLKEDVIDELTRTVLVNAIYFKGSWATPFAPADTTDEPFYRLDGSATPVPTMHQLIETEYARGDGWQAVRLPYIGASMLVIVPDAGEFQSVEQRIGSELLSDVRARLSMASVTLALPRWESETAVELEPLLAAMGMPDAFDPNVADFSRLSAPFGQLLYIDHVVHQANVTVNEEGTEAAAATAVVIDIESAGPPPVTVTVDRPFIYLIQDDASGEILFIGRLLTP